MTWRLHWKTTVRIRNEGSAGVPILCNDGYTYMSTFIMTDTIEGNRGSWEEEQKNQFRNRQRIYGLPCADIAYTRDRFFSIQYEHCNHKSEVCHRANTADRNASLNSS
jgi:hypothetical protein